MNPSLATAPASIVAAMRTQPVCRKGKSKKSRSITSLLEIEKPEPTQCFSPLQCGPDNESTTIVKPISSPNAYSHEFAVEKPRKTSGLCFTSPKSRRKLLHCLTVLSVVSSALALRISHEDLKTYIHQEQNNSATEVRLAISCSTYPMVLLTSLSQLGMLVFSKSQEGANGSIDFDGEEYSDFELGLPLGIKNAISMQLVLTGVWWLYEVLMDGKFGLPTLENWYLGLHILAFANAVVFYSILEPAGLRRMLKRVTEFTFGEAILLVESRR